MITLGIDIGGTSVKVCLADSPAGNDMEFARSEPYANPTRSELINAIGSAVSSLGVQIKQIQAVGMCLPGRQSPTQDSIEFSQNMPCLNGWRFAQMLESVLGSSTVKYNVLSDVSASGQAYLHANPCSGRVAIIAVGTGVGLGIFDNGEQVGIGGRGIGHLGMLDIGRLGDEDRFDNQGAKNTIESYLGARAIEERFPDVASALCSQEIGSLAVDEPIFQALVGMIRIVHAIYTPSEIVLMGGIGSAFSVHRERIYALANDGLTPMACSSWKLSFAAHPYFAAIGAARSCSRFL